MTITTIAFDGMHRSGKGTQIKLLANAAETSFDLVLTMRWEYYREGKGENSLTDPFSKWRQENKIAPNYDVKSNILMRELLVFFDRRLPTYMSKNNIRNALVILDRSVVWRYMFAHADCEITHTKNLLQVTISKGKEHLRNIIIPDLIFVLQPSKEELIERLHRHIQSLPIEQQCTTRNTYKKSYIPEKYEQYYAWLNVLPEHIKSRTHVITTDEIPEEVHKKVVEIAAPILCQKNWENSSYDISISLGELYDSVV